MAGQDYQERKDEEWYDLLKDFAKQINENNAIGIQHKEEIKKTLILIKNLIEGKIKECDSIGTPNITTKAEPLIIPKCFTGWLKFLFYECPKFSFSKTNRIKFLNDLGRIIRLLILVIVTAPLFLLANDNLHIRQENLNLRQIEL